MSEIIEKPWGYEEILEKNDKYVVKILHLNKGKRLSLQYHEVKTETLFLKDGRGMIEIHPNGLKKTLILLQPLQSVHIPAGQVHRMASFDTDDFELLEVSTPELDDVIRIEDDYGRIEVLEKSA